MEKETILKEVNALLSSYIDKAGTKNFDKENMAIIQAKVPGTGGYIRREGKEVYQDPYWGWAIAEIDQETGHQTIITFY